MWTKSGKAPEDSKEAADRMRVDKRLTQSRQSYVHRCLLYRFGFRNNSFVKFLNKKADNPLICFRLEDKDYNVKSSACKDPRWCSNSTTSRSGFTVYTFTPQSVILFWTICWYISGVCASSKHVHWSRQRLIGCAHHRFSIVESLAHTHTRFWPLTAPLLDRPEVHDIRAFRLGSHSGWLSLHSHKRPINEQLQCSQWSGSSLGGSYTRLSRILGLRTIWNDTQKW